MKLINNLMNTSTGRFKRIFAVDNNIKTLESIQFYFNENYRDVILDTYLDPTVAFQKFKKQFIYKEPYELAIIDLNMPKITGELLSVMLKEVDPTIKTVLYTGSNDDIFLKHFHVYGFDAILDKKMGVSVLNEISKMLRIPSFQKTAMA